MLDQLHAIEKALADPRRLVDAISTADDDNQAIEALSRAFRFTEQEAYAVINQQFRHLTRAAKAATQRDIARAQTKEQHSDHP